MAKQQLVRYVSILKTRPHLRVGKAYPVVNDDADKTGRATVINDVFQPVELVLGNSCERCDSPRTINRKKVKEKERAKAALTSTAAVVMGEFAPSFKAAKKSPSASKAKSPPASKAKSPPASKAKKSPSASKAKAKSKKGIEFVKAEPFVKKVLGKSKADLFDEYFRLQAVVEAADAEALRARKERSEFISSLRDVFKSGMLYLYEGSSYRVSHNGKTWFLIKVNQTNTEIVK